MLQREKQQNAQAMAACIKTTMPFYGFRAAEHCFIAKQVVKLYFIQNQKKYLDIVQEIWNQPFREEKYIAIDIAHAYLCYINVQALPLFEKMIRQRSFLLLNSSKIDHGGTLLKF